MVELDTAPVTFQLTRCFAIDKIMPVLRKPLGIVGFAPTMSWKGEQPAGEQSHRWRKVPASGCRGQTLSFPAKYRKLQD